MIERLATFTTPPILEVAEDVLVGLGETTTFHGQRIDLNESSWRAVCRTKDRRGSVGMATLLEELGYVNRGTSTMGDSGHDPVSISAGGWRRLDELKRVNTDSSQGFVAMSFDERLRPTYDAAIAPGIREAGYRPHRVDEREHSGKIDDEIVAQIRKSRFLIADYTEHKAGVYWEAGFARGLGLEVIPTCRGDHMKGLHFDIRQFNTISWSDHDDLRSRLAARIEATLGRGPLNRKVGG